MLGSSTINNNIGSGYGGGVFVNGTVTLGDETKITGNSLTNDQAANLWLGNGSNISLGTGDNAPKEGMHIGVAPQTAPTEDNPVMISTNSTANDVKYFTSDNPDYEVKFSTNHLELAVIHTHNPVLVKGQDPMEDAARWKDYYKCDCGAFFEDANGTI